MNKTDIDNMVTRRKGERGRVVRGKRVKYIVMKGNLTVGGEHTM